MIDATTSWNKSPELMKVAERAKRHPEQRILGLAHLIDEPALDRAFRNLRRDAAVGVDGVTIEQYGGQLATNLQALRARMKAGQYRHLPIRRVNIPKENGTTRPIGVSTVEDKIVQGAVRDVLEAVYEQDFLDCSYGFRPGRSAHDAIRTLNEVAWRGHANYIVEADIVSFFDNIDRARSRVQPTFTERSHTQVKSSRRGPNGTAAVLERTLTPTAVDTSAAPHGSIARAFPLHRGLRRRRGPRLRPLPASSRARSAQLSPACERSRRRAC